MFTIFRKELRENLKWAGVIFGVLAVMFAHEMRDANPLLLYRLSGQDMVWLVPLAGLLLGVVQSLFETRADNWAFVVHRPVSREGLFVAKCAAGLVLLFGALGLPCALAVWWSSVPGNLPMPFQWRMVLPLTADVLSAGCYYFAGIVLTLRKARWFGTRVLPLGLAFVCSVMVRLSPEFWQALACIVAGQCVGAIAACGVFATGGSADRGRAGRIALGTMIYGGALTLGTLGVGMLGIFESTVHWRQTRMDLAGNLVQIDKTLDDGELSYAVTDAAGRAVTSYEGINLDDPANADQFVQFTAPMRNDRLLPWPMTTMIGDGYRSARAGVRGLRTFGKPGARIASAPLFNVQEGLIDLYDPVTCVLAGRVGPGGYTAGDSMPVVRFAGEPLDGSSQGSTRTLAFSSDVYWMELDQRRVRKIFTAGGPDDEVVSAHELRPPTGPTIVIATRKRLVLVSPLGVVQSSIPLEIDLNRYSLQAALLPAHHHLALQCEAVSPDLEDAFPTMYLEYSTDGKLVRKTQWPEAEDDGGVKLARTAAFGFVHPLAGIPLHRAWMVDAIWELDSQHRVRLFYGMLALGSLLAGAATWILCRRLGFDVGKSAAWTVGNLLIGPAGLAVLVGLYEWPARETCDVCGGERLAGRRDCLACGAGMRAVESDGREIFEPVGANLSVA
jgi:hypothetical protein